MTDILSRERTESEKELKIRVKQIAERRIDKVAYGKES